MHLYGPYKQINASENVPPLVLPNSAMAHGVIVN